MATKTVLVVDDSPTEAKLVVNLLQKKGCHVLTAANGEEALAKAGRDKPSLIILDVVMPGKNGFQTCRELKSSPETQQIPVVLLTSKKQDSDKFWGFRQGADGYLTKPFSDEALWEQIEKLI